MLEKTDSQETFGDYLKKERNMRGVTLEEISKKTNISFRFLYAIENDKYDNLPPDVFVKGFLRAYSTCIGIEPNEVILAYSEHKDAHNEHGYPQPDKKIDLIEKEKSKKLLYIFFCILSFIAFLVAVFYFRSSFKGPLVEKEAPVMSAAEEDNAVPDENIDENIDTNLGHEISKEPKTFNKGGKSSMVNRPVASKKILPEKIKSVEQEKKSIAIQPLQVHTLSIYATESVWLRVLVDYKEPREALLNEGEQVTYKATDRFVLTLGNIKGSIVSLDGEDLLLPDTKSKILRNYEILLNKPEKAENKDEQ